MISLRCINSVRRILCHLIHPVCFKSEEDGRIISSPPCRRLCIESDCEDFIKTRLYNITLQMHKLCPNRIGDPRNNRDGYTCARFPMADMKHIERCQNISKSGKTINNVTTICFIIEPIIFCFHSSKISNDWNFPSSKKKI